MWMIRSKNKLIFFKPVMRLFSMIWFKFWWGTRSILQSRLSSSATFENPSEQTHLENLNFTWFVYSDEMNIFLDVSKPFCRKATDAIGNLTIDIGVAEVTDQTKHCNGRDRRDFIVVGAEQKVIDVNVTSRFDRSHRSTFKCLSSIN